MKIIINTCHGGFGLSEAAKQRLRELGEPLAVVGKYVEDIPRDDARLVQVVEELGAAAHGCHAELRVVTIPDGTDWEILEHAGAEFVQRKTERWY